MSNDQSENINSAPILINPRDISYVDGALPESVTMSHGEEQYPYGVLDRYAKFYCDGCGECCRNVSNAAKRIDLFKELDLGNGVCRHLCGDKCEIYNTRPDWCSVDRAYSYFEGSVTKKEFYDMNYVECYRLKQKRMHQEKREKRKAKV